MKPIGRPETSVTNHQSMLRNFPKSENLILILPSHLHLGHPIVFSDQMCVWISDFSHKWRMFSPNLSTVY